MIFVSRVQPLVFSCVLLMALLAPALAGTPDAVDPWAAWSDNFDSAMSACVKAAQSACLSKAFRDRERPPLDGAAPDITDVLYRDLRAAETLLHQKDARDELWRSYGIDGSGYLGTGYSVPLEGAFAHEYTYARQREYFVPNLCAEAVDAAACPQKDGNVWAWRLSAKDLAQWLNRPVASLVSKRAPQTDAAGFLRKIGPNAPIVRNNLPNLLIRFGSLPLAYYKGTVGRPGAVRVFFADYLQVKGKTLHDAVVATGASSLLKPDPSKTFFIWIYAPPADSKAKAASWNALFALLSTAD